MNCTRFRYLIQKNFDCELTKQDENSLLKHIDNCDTCSKYNHQIQQVVLSTQDFSLPKSLQPSNPEALAKNIIDNLPKLKTSFLFVSRF